MKKRFTYRIPATNNCGFDVDVENKQTCIELSNLKLHSNIFKFDNAETLRNKIVGKYSAQYTQPDERTKKGRKVISDQLTEKINSMKDEIKEYELIIQMCRKKNVKLFYHTNSNQ